MKNKSYLLLQPAANVERETLMELLKPSIDYVRHKKFRSGNYPSSLSNETDRLVHWCHGAPGVIHMLMQAYKVRPCLTHTMIVKNMCFEMKSNFSDF